MKILSGGLIGFVILGLLVSSGASAKVTGITKRQKEEQACYNDATKLCQEFVPDEEKITACMTAKKSQLSPSCLKVFEEDMKAKK